jgi:hypothetical protein
VLVARRQDRLQKVKDELLSEFPDLKVHLEVLDVADLGKGLTEQRERWEIERGGALDTKTNPNTTTNTNTNIHLPITYHISPAQTVWQPCPMPCRRTSQRWRCW